MIKWMGNALEFQMPGMMQSVMPGMMMSHMSQAAMQPTVPVSFVSFFFFSFFFFPFLNLFLAVAVDHSLLSLNRK